MVESQKSSPHSIALSRTLVRFDATAIRLILPVKSVAFDDLSGAPVFSVICSGGLPGGLSLLKPGHRIRLQGPEQLPRGPIGDYVVRNEGELFLSTERMFSCSQWFKFNFLKVVI